MAKNEKMHPVALASQSNPQHGVSPECRGKSISGNQSQGCDNIVNGLQGIAKRKKTVSPGNCYPDFGSTSSNIPSSTLASHSAHLRSSQLFESANVMGTGSFTLPGYSEDISWGIEWNAWNAACIHPDPELMHHSQSLFQGNTIMHSFQPAGIPWWAQFGNSFGHAYPNANHMHSINSLQGSCPTFMDGSIANMGMQLYHEFPLSANSSFVWHPPSMPGFHQHQAVAPNVQTHPYCHQLPSPSHPRFGDLHPRTLNHNLDSSQCSSYGFLPLPPTVELAYCPFPQHAEANIELEDEGMRIILTEEEAFQERPWLYGVGENTVDRHRDMRMDIDDLSYEELLALEERIGDVSTGLLEESVAKHLKTSLHATQPTRSTTTSDGGGCSACPGPSENETCSICQMEYEEKETIGTLQVCGHKYHSGCIKQWLLVKNSCPICKASAVAAFR